MNKNTLKFNVITVAFLSFAHLTIVAMAEPIVNKKFVDMQTIQSMCNSIYKKATQGGDVPFKPEFIIGLCRGGLVPLAFLAGESMFNNHNITTISITSYSDEGNQSNIKPLFPLSDEGIEYLKQFNSILVVDDLVDSGKSLTWVTTTLKKHLPGTNIKTATLFYKKKSSLKPDYYVEETEDWIVFPWEDEENK